MGWLLKNRKSVPVRKNIITSGSDAVKSDFRAVKIKPDKTACHSASTVSAKMFLCNEAPLLPLNSCDCRDKCKCCYLHYSDRRQDGRRESDNGFPVKFVEGERRAKMDRRRPQLLM